MTRIVEVVRQLSDTKAAKGIGLNSAPLSPAHPESGHVILLGTRRVFG